MRSRTGTLTDGTDSEWGERLLPRSLGDWHGLPVSSPQPQAHNPILHTASLRRQALSLSLPSLSIVGLSLSSLSACGGFLS